MCFFKGFSTAWTVSILDNNGLPYDIHYRIPDSISSHLTFGAIQYDPHVTEEGYFLPNDVDFEDYVPHGRFAYSLDSYEKYNLHLFFRQDIYIEETFNNGVYSSTQRRKTLPGIFTQSNFSNATIIIKIECFTD